MKVAFSDNEESRLAALAAYKVLEDDSNYIYSDFIKIASHIAQVPIVLISLVDRDKQIFKFKMGLEAGGTPREQSFCAHAILTPHDLFVVEDATKDDRFSDNPLVTGEMGLRFYCGVPLVTQDNYALGTLCVIDKKPRTLSKEQQLALQALGRRVMNSFEVHKTFKELEGIVSQSPATEAIDEIEDLTQKLGNLLLKRKDAEKTEFK